MKQTPWAKRYRSRIWSTLSSTSRFLGRIISCSRGIRRKESGAGSCYHPAARSADTPDGRPCATGHRPSRRHPADSGDTGPGSRCLRPNPRRPALGSHRIRSRPLARRCSPPPRAPRRRGVPYAGIHFPEAAFSRPESSLERGLSSDMEWRTAGD